MQEEQKREEEAIKAARGGTTDQLSTRKENQQKEEKMNQELDRSLSSLCAEEEPVTVELKNGVPVMLVAGEPLPQKERGPPGFNLTQKERDRIKVRRMLENPNEGTACSDMSG